MKTVILILVVLALPRAVRSEKPTTDLEVLRARNLSRAGAATATLSATLFLTGVAMMFGTSGGDSWNKPNYVNGMWVARPHSWQDDARVAGQVLMPIGALSAIAGCVMMGAGLNWMKRVNVSPTVARDLAGFDFSLSF